MINNNKIIVNTVLSIIRFGRKKDEVTETCITGFLGKLMKKRWEQIKLFMGWHNYRKTGSLHSGQKAKSKKKIAM